MLLAFLLLLLPLSPLLLLLLRLRLRLRLLLQLLLRVLVTGWTHGQAVVALRKKVASFVSVAARFWSVQLEQSRASNCCGLMSSICQG